jgi:hypothetical protein
MDLIPVSCLLKICVSGGKVISNNQVITQQDSHYYTRVVYTSVEGRDSDTPKTV